MAEETALQEAQRRINALEQELREARQRLDELTGVINRSPAVVVQWRVAAGWPVAYVSESIRQFGYAPEDFLSGQVAWYDFIHPDDAARVEAEVAEVVRQATPAFTLTFCVRTRKGGMRWAEAHVITLMGDGRPICHEGILLDVTARRQAELARDESERKFADLFHFSPIPFSIHGLPDGRFQDVNAAFEEASGYTKAEVLGQTTISLGLWDEETREHYRQLLLSTGRLSGIEQVLRVKDGSRHTCLLYAQILHIDHQHSYLTAVIDITARKAAEEALRNAYAEIESRVEERTAALEASRARLNHSEAIAHLGHYEVDLVHDQTTWSDELYRIFGIDPQPMTTEKFLSMVHPEDRATMRHIIEDSLGPTPSTDQSQSNVYRIIRGDGTVCTVTGTGIVERDAAGRPMRLFGTVQDITERKRIEDALRESAERLAQAEHLAHLGNFELLVPEMQVLWSAEAFRIVGRDLTQDPPTVDEYMTRYVHPEDRESLSKAIETTLREGTSFTLLYRLHRDDGILRQIQTIVHPMRDSEGHITRVFGTMLDVTEQMETESRLQQLNRSLQIYARLVDNAPDALLVVDRDYRFTIVNITYARMHGMDREAVIGHPISEVVGEDYFRNNLRPSLDQALAGEELHYEKWYPYPDIGERYLDVRYFPLYDNGTVGWVAVVLRDITERRAAEEALMDSEARFRAFSEATTEGIVIHDRGQILDVNRAFVEHLGYSYDEMLRMNLFDMVAPESRAYALARVQANDPGPYEAISFHKDGSRTVGEIRARGIHFRGRDVRVVAIREITERKRAEEQMRALLSNTEQWAAELDATISAIADAVIIYNLDATITRLNTAARRLLEYSEQETAQSFHTRANFLRVETPDGRVLPLKEMPPMRALHGETITGMLLAVHPHGREVWVSVSAAPIRRSDGTVVGAVATLSDITSLRNLQQRQEELLHLVSHDLRTPLAVIHGHLQLLEEVLEARHLNGDLRLNAATISRSVQRMNVMIQDLVDLARLEGGQMQLTLESVALPAFLPDLVHRMEGVLETRRIVLEVPGDIPAVQADYARLERILVNLLSNALKYSTPETTVIIRVYRAEVMVAIAVTDQGRGIAPEDLPHLFERFYRGHGGPRAAEGLGLGLYITRMLVEAHGGRIEVTSTVGQGSTFTVYLRPA